MPSAKENGWILSIDQASNVAGVVLLRNGELHSHTTLNSDSPKDGLGKRLARQVEQLEDWLNTRLGKAEIKVVLFEGVRSRIVLCTVGAFCVVPQLRNCKVHPRLNFIESPVWKRWCIKNGATDKKMADIKGVKTLREVGFDVDAHGIDSDDVADALLQYFAWRDRK